MPTVPRFSTPQVQSNPLPAVRGTTSATPELMGGAAAQQGQQLGQALTSVGNDLSKIAIDAQQQANQLRVDDALNQAKEAQLQLTYGKDTGYTNIKGYNALQRDSGMPLSDEYSQKLQQSFDGISASLGNDAQRRAFQMRANDMLTQFRGQASQYEGQQFRDYSLSTADGIISTAQRDIGLNYNNPQMVGEAVERIKAETYRQGQLLGKSAEWVDARARQMTSNAHLVAIDAAIQKNDPAYADAYLKKFSGGMDANDILRASGLITKQMDARISASAAGTVMTQAMPSIIPSDATRLTNLVTGDGNVDFARLDAAKVQAESGGRRYGADGKLLEGPVTKQGTAKGEHQVMDATAAKPGYGIRPATPGDPDDLARVGSEKLKAMLQRYQGNVPQALAAYNWGEGNVDKAIKQAASTGDKYREAQPNDWLAYAPKDTQAYVSKIIAAYNAGGGAPRKPSLQELHDQVRQLVGTDNPERLRLAEAEVSRRYDEANKAIKQREDEGVAAAQQALIQNGGDFNALPANVRMGIPAGQFDNVLAFAGKVSKGQPIETDWQLYYQLKSDPQVLGAANLMALRGKLGDTEFKQLTNEQQDIRSGKTEQMTNLRTGKEYLAQFMREAGIDPTPKDTDKEGAALVGRIWNAFEDRVRARESDQQRKLKPDEMKQEAAALFTSVEVNRPFWFNKTMPAAAVAGTQSVVVPDADRKQITDALRKAGKPVNDAAVQDIYRRAKNVAPLASNG